MVSTFTNLLYHVVYGTKHRRGFIQPRLRDEFYDYIGGIVRGNRGIVIEIGGMPDHVHLLARLSPTIAIADILRLIKSNSSKWINERADQQQRFEWQSGYAAFSVSESQVRRAARYIQHQEEHHKTSTFEDELTALLRKHNIEFDERHLFEETHLA